MSYEKNTWAEGDVVTSEKLNHIEDGVANAGGGGSSDFSTAEVTIENNTSDELGCILPLITEKQFFELAYTVLEANESMTIQLPLYKNNILLDGYVVFIQDSVISFSVSGAITENMDTIIISGDGTIEITTSGGLT